MKRLITLLLWASPIWAACTGSSPTWTSTPDFASVNSCFSSSSRNDTINVSAGSATWSSTLTITHGITLTGAGAANVKITASAVSPLISIAPDATAISNSELITISGLTLDGGGAAGSLNLIGIVGAGSSGTLPYRYFIIKNNTFQNNNTNDSGNGVVSVTGQARGVISTNHYHNVDILMKCLGNDTITEWQNTAYNQVISALGTEDNIYMENNTIDYTAWSTTDPGWTECGQGGRFVERYDTFNFTGVTPGGGSELNDIHGFQNFPGGETGSMVNERYGNTYTTVQAFRCLNFRGGVMIAHNNSFSGSGGCSFDILGESTTSGFCPSDLGSPSPFNFNPTPNAGYFFNNPVNGTNKLATLTYGSSFPCTITENNSASVGSIGPGSQGAWWNLNLGSCTSSSCTAGIGEGTTVPTGSCTVGTGYWVNATPGASTTPSVVQAGKFYRCNPANTWTLFYTPYTYPHPLAGGAASPIATFTPSSVNISQVPVNLTGNPVSVTLQNTGTANLVVTSVVVTNPPFFVQNNTCGSPATLTTAIPGTGFTLTPSASCTFQIVPQPTSIGLFTGGVNFFDNTAGSEDSILLSGTATGQPAPATTLFAKAK